MMMPKPQVAYKYAITRPGLLLPNTIPVLLSELFQIQPSHLTFNQTWAVTADQAAPAQAVAKAALVATLAPARDVEYVTSI
jgi:hypothetical protein